MDIKFINTGLSGDEKHNLEIEIGIYFELQKKVNDLTKKLKVDDSITDHITLYEFQHEMEKVKSGISSLLAESDLLITTNTANGSSWIEVKPS